LFFILISRLVYGFIVLMCFFCIFNVDHFTNFFARKHAVRALPERLTKLGFQKPSCAQHSGNFISIFYLLLLSLLLWYQFVLLLLPSKYFVSFLFHSLLICRSIHFFGDVLLLAVAHGQSDGVCCDGKHYYTFGFNFVSQIKLIVGVCLTERETQQPFSLKE
jgi:hypothetical protein